MRFLRNSSGWQWLLLLVVVLACSWPLFSAQMFFTHDFIHGVRIAEMARALQDGHFPVRWSSNFAYGYGMPLFEFYAPLPFYVGSLFYLLGVPLIASVKLVFLLSNIGTAIGSYLLGRKFAGKWGGVLAATLITLAPYRAINLFIRGAISEVWGITALVWVLYSTVLVLQRKKYSQFLLIVSLIALFLSHNLLTMIGAPFIALWTVSMFVYVNWETLHKGGKQIWQLVIKDVLYFGFIYLLAIGTASFYLVPAFVEKDLTKVEQATTAGYFDYNLHFLYIRQFFRPGWGYGGSEWGPDDKLSFFLGFGQVLALVTAAVMVVIAFVKNIYGTAKSQTTQSLAVFVTVTSGLLMLLALAMTVGKSAAIWHAVEFFKYVQFPWRFYSAALIFVGLAAVGGYQVATQFISKKFVKIFAALIIILTIGVNWQYFKPEYYLEDGSALYYDNPTRTREHMSGILPDYIPRDIPQNPPVSESLVNCAQFSVCGTVEVLTEKTQLKELTISMLQDGAVTFDIAQYPGWKAWVDGQEVPIQTDEAGLVVVPIPAGDHLVKLEFTNSPIRQLSDTVALISLLGILGWAAYLWVTADFLDDEPEEEKPTTGIELEQHPAGSNQAQDTEEAEAATVTAIKTKSMSGAMSYFGRTILLNVVGLGSALLLSKYFSPEDFGLYGLVTQVIGILIFFSDIGLAAALVQKKSEPSKHDYATVFTIQQILAWAIVLLCLALIGLGVFEGKFGATGNWILLALAVSFPLAALKTIPSIILERKLDFSKLVVPQIVEQLTFHGVLLYLAWGGYGAIAYAYAVIARSVLGVVVLYRIAPWKISVALSKDSLRTLLSFGAKFQLNDALARVKDQLFFMAIGLYFPLNQFGFIQWAKNWSLYPYNLTVQNVMAITFPTFSRLQHNKALLRRAIEKSLFFISLLIFPIIVGMVVYIYPMVDLIPDYHKWYPALPSFILFTVSVLFSAISSPLTNALNAVGKINKTLRLMVLWTVLTWVLTPICIFYFGFTGVSVAALLIGLTAILPIWYMKRVVELAVWDQLKLPVLASVAMTVSALGLLKVLPLNWPILLAVMIVSGAAYVGTLFVLGKHKMLREITPLVSIIKRKL